METISFACKNVPIEQVIRCGLGLSKGEYELLRIFLKNNDERDIDDIANISKKDRSTIQKQIKNLVDNGIFFRRQVNQELGGYRFYYRIKDKEKLKSMIIENFKNYQARVLERIEKM